jgi:FKBP-type peptidyl-prolyl cis-trans isomerase (trigger factor)
MGSIERRIESLEQRILPLEETAAEANRRQFLWRALDAIAHVKRSSIDPEQWRYSVEKLRQQSPSTVAAYVCVLRDQNHEDEVRAREILEQRAKDEGVDLAALEKLMDAFAALASRARAEQHRYGT